MNVAVILLILRIVSALLLLTFLGIIIWLAYRDLQSPTRAWEEMRRNYGYLRLVEEEADMTGEKGKRFPLSSVNSIGRAPTNSIFLDDTFVSNEHALLTLRGQQWWLTDMNSRNGTLLNGVRLTGVTIVSAGDVIGIGEIKLVLEPADVA